MFIISSYMLAGIFCFITMLCWGSLGVLVFKEFKVAPASINRYLITMFVTFIAGLRMIIIARL